jgi:ferritin
MEIPKGLERLLNNQINNEYQSAYIYLGMAAYFETTPYDGFARWMRLQASEEVGHGSKFFSYVASRGGEIELKDIGRVATAFESPLDAFAKAYAHEQRVSNWIHDIYELAVLEKDYETTEFLNWFIREQVEEEQQTKAWVDKLKIAASRPELLLALNCEARERTE